MSDSKINPSLAKEEAMEMAPPSKPAAVKVPPRSLATAMQILRDTMTQLWNQPVCDQPTMPVKAVREHHVRIIKEEVNELCAAILANDIIGTADGFADSFVVLLGGMCAFGMPPEIFDEVCASNLSKLDDDGKPVKDALGKVLKGANYRPPALKEILLAHGAYIPAAQS